MDEQIVLCPRSHTHQFAATCLSALLSAALCGCLSGPATNVVRVNTIQIPAGQYDLMWERSVAVLNDLHFLIARESKLEGVIETQFRAGANLLEPWHRDSADYGSRLESTLQSIRRRVIITMQNTGADTFSMSVRVDKQIEDLPGLAANYEGGATFSESQPLNRDLNQVLGQSTASRWLPYGRDPRLEAQILNRIQHAHLQ